MKRSLGEADSAIIIDSLPPRTIPDWSTKTLAALARLTPLEAAFVEWLAAGYSATEAYRRAAGNKGSNRKYGRQYAHALKERTHVQAALELALKDRSFGARYDREWMLQQLGSLVQKCREDGTPAAGDLMLNALKLMGQLQGELSSERLVRAKPEQAKPVKQNIMQRIEELVAAVTKR